MTTRAANIQFLLSGLSSTTTGEPINGGTVEFYASGTSTPKYVWTEREKTNGYYSYDLDAVGAANLFGEGQYKIIIKDSSGATVDTLDPIRLEFPYYGIRTVTTGTVTMVTQDDFILCNTSGGNITLNCLASSSWVRPLKLKRISGINTITITPYGSETIDGAATLDVTSDAIVEIITDGSNLMSAGFRSEISDADNDTKIVFDESPDEDIIRFYASNSNIINMQEGFDVDAGQIQPVLYVSGQVRVQHNNIIIDNDKYFVGGGLGDTVTKEGKLFVYESGPHTIYISGGLSIDGNEISQNTHVNHVDGYPLISTDTINITSDLTQSTWESIGPTGSGDNDWTALDALPLDIDWIDVKFHGVGFTSSGGSGSYHYFVVYVRKTGSSVGAAAYTMAIKGLSSVVSGVSRDDLPVVHRVPVDSSNRFDAYWTTTFETATTINLYLVGYGKNP